MKGVYIVCGILAFFVFAEFAMIKSANVKIGRLKKRYDRLLHGNSKDVSLEQLLYSLHDKADLQKEEIDKKIEEINSVKENAQGAFQKNAIVKYDAFGQRDNRSFSVCFCDGEDNGFILTSLYGRENSSVFAKIVKGGEADSPLSKEEEICLKKALRR